MKILLLFILLFVGCSTEPTDCFGIPGGNYVLDNCGNCDDDPSNDCEQDCAGVWGGKTTQEACDHCYYHIFDCENIMESNLLAAFDDNNNVRGIASILLPPFGPNQGKAIYEMQLRSNDIQGDILSFKYYNASENLIYDIQETIIFFTDTIIGNVLEPFKFNIGAISLGSQEHWIDCPNCYEFSASVSGEIILQDGHSLENDCIVNNTFVSQADCEQDCAGTWGGGAIIDCEGKCGGNNFTCLDCTGVVPNGDSEYDCNGVCGGDNNSSCSDCAGIPYGNAENCPDWTDDPGAYEFTSTLVGAIVLYDDIQMGGEGDELAAFDIDGNVRGVAVDIGSYLDFGPYAGTAIWEMTMRSNDNGDLIFFQYYDASNDIVYNISEQYTFLINDVMGGLFSPIELNINITDTLNIELLDGWNWISINLSTINSSTESVLEILGDNALFVRSLSGTATNYGSEYGWYGSLVMIEPSQMYKLQLNEPSELIVTGIPIDVLETPISLISGWNWLGYLPKHSSRLSLALDEINVNGAIILSQEAHSQYYDGFGWYGSLEYMHPGKGYKLYMPESKSFMYPEINDTNGLNRKGKPKHIPSLIADWNVSPYTFEFNGVINLRTADNNDKFGDYIAAFKGNECRGIAKYSNNHPRSGDYGVYNLMVYSNVKDGDKLSFKYYNSTNNEVISFSNKLEFTSNMIIGNALEPYVINQTTK